MQSGISASKELLTAFQSLVSDTSQRGLLATIKDEQLIPTHALPSTTTDFSSDLSCLTPHISDTEALYIILRRYPEVSDGFIAITYVPNAAKVRQKMLFASTRLTLTRELGIERFRETMFCTEKSELTAEGFKKHDKHVKQAAPLTEEEESLGAIKRAEAEAGRGMTAQKSALSGMTGAGMSMPVDEEAMAALKSLVTEKERNLVQLKLELPGEKIVLDAHTNCSASALSTTIATDAPRFSFYRYNEIETAPLLFIYTCPSGSKVKERMVYSTSRAYVASKVAEEAGLTVDKKIEASDPDDISATALADEFKAKVEVKKTFARPARPGKR